MMISRPLPTSDISQRELQTWNSKKISGALLSDPRRPTLGAPGALHCEKTTGLLSRMKIRQ